MTSRDWLDEQMDEADLWREAEELRRDEIEANLPDEGDEPEGYQGTLSPARQVRGIHDLPIFGWAWTEDAKQVER